MNIMFVLEKNFINTEFTKIICDINYKYNPNIDFFNLPFEYKENRGITCDFDFTKYIDKNVPQRKVKSSLSSVIDEANKQRKKAEKGLFISFIVALIALGAIIYAGYQLTISSVKIIDDARERIETSKNQEIRFNELQETINKLQQEIIDLKQDKYLKIESKRTNQEEMSHKFTGQAEINSKGLKNEPH
jgi:hypothetical protein